MLPRRIIKGLYDALEAPKARAEMISANMLVESDTIWLDLIQALTKKIINLEYRVKELEKEPEE